MIRTAIHESAILSILAPVSRHEGGPKCWPVLVKRGRWRAEPVILHEIGREFWREDAPRVLSIKEASKAARELAESSFRDKGA